MSRATVLVADDEPALRLLTKAILERAGFDVVEAHDGQEALRGFYDRRPDVVVLDVSMPNLDGWQTLERIRELSDVPVLMLTARSGELDKVRGLRGGADDYVTKPFSGPELVARLEGLLRRRGGTREQAEVYSDGRLTLDFAQRRTTVDGEPVALTPLEFRLLSAFVRHPGQVLTHDQLVALGWGDALAGSRDQLKIYVGYLRRKLAAAGMDEAIETVRGFGYRYGSAR